MAFKPLIAAATILVNALAPAAQAQDPEPHHYVIATASEFGTYYPIGVALALVARINLEASDGISMEAVTSSGTIDNVGRLGDGSAQFAIMQALIGHWAWEGDKTFAEDGRQEHLRAVTMLWPDVSHFLILSELAETGTVEDLANLEGHGFSIGALGSGSEVSNRFLLENYGFEFDGWSLSFLQFEEAIQALHDGLIAGANIESGLGVEIVHRALSQMGDRLTLLSVTDEQRARFDGGSGRVFSATIPAGTYPVYEDAMQSIAQPNFLAVDASVPDEDVYLITRTIYENLGYLCELQAAACEMTPQSALTGLPVPLHPGAERYFREIGLDIPELPATQQPEAAGE